MDEDRCEGAEHREPTAPSVDGLIARLEAATEGSRELDAAVALRVERQQWPHVKVRELDGEDDYPRSAGSRRECLVREGGTDDWAIVHGGDWGATYPVPHHTTSLDAALTLVPEGWRVYAIQEEYIVPPYHYGSQMGKGPNPALALCTAALKARSAVPPTGCMELGERPNTESSPTTAAARWQATLEAEKAAILDFAVDGKIGDDPSPPAVVDYTREAENLAQQLIAAANREGVDTYTQTMLWHASSLIDRQSAALSAVASEHQAALLARLLEPEMREALIWSLCPLLKRWTDKKPEWPIDCKRCPPADAALAVITEKLT